MVKFLNFGTPEIFAVIYLNSKRPNLRVFHQKDVNGIANSEDPDQTAPRSSLIWVCTTCICPDQSVRKLRIITVASVAVLHCLCYTWSETLKTCFPMKEAHFLMAEADSLRMGSMVIT